MLRHILATPKSNDTLTTLPGLRTLQSLSPLGLTLAAVRPDHCAETHTGDAKVERHAETSVWASHRQSHCASDAYGRAVHTAGAAGAAGAAPELTWGGRHRFGQNVVSLFSMPSRPCWQPLLRLPRSRLCPSQFATAMPLLL